MGALERPRGASAGRLILRLNRRCRDVEGSKSLPCGVVWKVLELEWSICIIVSVKLDMKYANLEIFFKLHVLSVSVQTSNTFKSHPYSAKAFIYDPHSVPEWLVCGGQALGRCSRRENGQCTR
jgi:hypothetical protein